MTSIFQNPKDGAFAVVGLEAAGDKSGKLTSSGFSVTYDALLERYVMVVPSMGNYFYRKSAGDVDPDWLIGTLASEVRTFEQGQVNVLKPSNSQLTLTYTTLAGYNTSTSDVPYGWFAFGQPTTRGSVPVTGSASYNAIIRGSISNMNGPQVLGSAALSFDFGAGSLSGHLDPVLHDPSGLGFQDIVLGRYDLISTVYASGSGVFSADLSNSKMSGLGSLNGQFTGPAAQELMARWSAPFQYPGFNDFSQIFGVLVGKKN